MTQLQINKAAKSNNNFFLTMDEVNTDIDYELSEMGFKGSYLSNLLSVIVDEETLQEFYNFIILKGQNMTKLLLAHKFVIYMQDKRSFETCQQFEEAYIRANSISEKHNVIAKLLVSTASTEQINKFLSLIEAKNLSLNLLYERCVRYRRLYTMEEIITLIERFPIS